MKKTLIITILAIICTSSLCCFAYTDERKEHIQIKSAQSLYMSKVQQKIKRYWHPTRDSQMLGSQFTRSPREVTILFTVDKDGHAKNYRVKKTSGNRIFDNQATKAIRDASPFEPLPETLKVEEIDISFTFNYRQ